MSAKNDFHVTIERAAEAAFEATCEARAAGRRPLPTPHRHLLTAAVRKLEGAQDDLFRLKNDPWTPPKFPKHQQLSLAA